MSDIIVMGEVMIELAPLGERQYSASIAGDTYNTACTLQGLGHTVSYLTALGTGEQASRIRSAATSAGLTLVEPPIDPTRSPGLYMISNDASGERSFEYWRNDSAASALFKQTDTLHALLEPLMATAYWYFSGITLALMSAVTRQMFLTLLSTYRKLGGIVIFDPNYRPALWSSHADAAQVIAEAQCQVDIYLPGFDEEEVLFGFASIEAAAAALLLKFEAGEVVMKNGSKSCTLITNGAIQEISILPAQHVLDTTGAGDTFNGAYIAARLASLNPNDAVAFAARAASEVLQVRGGRLKTGQLATLKALLSL